MRVFPETKDYIKTLDDKLLSCPQLPFPSLPGMPQLAGLQQNPQLLQAAMQLQLQQQQQLNLLAQAQGRQQASSTSCKFPSSICFNF